MELRGFVGPSYISQSPFADCEDLINYYVEQVQSAGGTTKAALYPTPGVNLLGAEQVLLEGLVGRAHFAQNGREFAVFGEYFVEVDSAGVVDDWGVVALDNNPATICGNGDAGDQLFITSGGNGYIFTLSTNAFTTVSALAGIAHMGDYLDGYFLALNVNASILRISDLLDGTVWDPTQFIQNSATPDNWVSMKVFNRQIYLFGSKTTQVWFDAGSFPIPFELHPSGIMQYGCAAPFSPEIVGSSLCWLAGTDNGEGAVIRTGGFTPEVISNFALHYAFDNYPTIADAVGDSYEDLGHTFYLLSFPTANVTWAWDTQSGWAKRGTWDADRNQFAVWSPIFHAFAFGQHRVLDIRGNRIYQLSSDFNTDVDEKVIRRVRRSPATVDENNLLYYSMFELDLQPGLALISGQGSEPVVMLRYSDDNGMTWSNEIEASPGLRAEYSARCQWNRLGAGRRRVFEIVVTDPIPWRIMGAWIKVTRSLRSAA